MEGGPLLSILVVILSLFTVTGCIELKVYISQSAGKDGNICTLESPCKTLDYGYKKAMDNVSISSLDLVLIGSYVLRNSFIVNTSIGHLETLKVSGYHEAEVVGSQNTSIVIGCRGSSRCIDYDFSIEDLVFRSYSKVAAILAYNAPSVIITNCTFLRNYGALLEGYDTSVLLNRSIVIGKQSELQMEKFAPFHSNRSICNGGKMRFVFENGYGKYVKIHDSQFFNSSASMADDSICGGALTLVFGKNSSNNNVTIHESRFEGNRAQFGGGLSIRLLGGTSSNMFLITNTVFFKNHAVQSGGAFFFEAFEDSAKNSICFRNVTFLKNNAKSSGGAGKLIFHNLENEMLRHRFEATKFIENRAKIQAAIGLMKTHRASPFARRMVVVFKDTYFSANSFLENSSFIHSGVLCAFHVDVQFSGNNVFTSNQMNSPLYACGSSVSVSGNLSFNRNLAYYAGGGMSLMDGSKLNMMPGVHVEFYKNYAAVAGGAIFYESNLFDSEIIPYNPLCFMQYGEKSVAARDWNITMSFIANGAGHKGGAVYATTINQCVWIPDQPYKNAKEALRWSDRFNYTSNYVGSYKNVVSSKGVSNKTALATDTSRYVVRSDPTHNAFPGENITLHLQALDEYGQETSTFSTLVPFDLINETTVANSSISIDRQVVYSDPRYPNITQFSFSIPSEDDYNLVLNGKMRNKQLIEAIDQSSIHGARMQISIIPEPCPPGYKFDLGYKSCVCDYSLQGLTGCQGRIIRIQEGMWANVSQKSPNVLIIYNCPRSYCRCNPGESHRSDCEFNPVSPDRQCNSNREGMLCGKCRSGSSMTLPSYRCKACSGVKGSIAVFVLFMVMTFALCIAVVYFNPELSEFLKAILFYTQILPYVFTDSESFSASVATIFCTFVNSVAVGSLPVEMCLVEGLDRIDAIGLSFIIPSVCTLILAMFYILNSCGVLNFHRDSPFNAFWILIIVVFKLLVDTTLQSLSCHRIDGDLVFFFDASVKCFSKEHLALFVPSVVILACLVIPFPFVIILISFGYIRVPPHISDIITKGYRDKYRWWCAFDLCRRLAYAAIYFFVSDWTMKKILLVFLSVFISTTHAIVSPYKNKHANYGESFLLGFLTIIAAAQALPDSEKTARNIASIIAITPTIVYTLLVVVYLFVIRVRQQNCYQQKVDESLAGNQDRPLPAPKRVLFERTVYRSNRRGSDADDENNSSQPSACCNSSQELCSMKA